jgi:hypothetical protein
MAVALVHLLGLPSGATAAAEWSVSSPEAHVTLTVRQAEAAGGTGGNLEYTVACDGAVVLDASPLGIARDDAAFEQALALEGAGPATLYESRYTVVHGKYREVHERYRQQVLTFRNSAGARVEIQLRAYDDGAAFRYRFPDEGREPRTVLGERTGFHVPAGSQVWSMPYDDPSQYTPAYENFWEDAIPAGTPSPKAAGWAFPFLFRTPGGRWGLVTEAALDGSYCGSRLAQQAPGNVYHLRFPDPGEGNGTGSVQPSSALPWTTPWRVIVAGSSLAPIVESTLVENLNPPSTLADTSWIKPGRCSWSWLFDPSSPQDCTKLKRFVDLAADMGCQYTLVDANWDIMQNGTVHDVIAYAKSRGVGVLLWYNSGGAHNVVTERPRGLMDQRKVRRFEFERLARWGVKGVKIDFFQSDKQNVIRLYHEILEDAADFKIMVNFHGCSVPRGWSRTFPHLMSMEAVKGEENYQFEPRYPALAPRHNTTLPFTRNAVGPMDYTPTMFQDNVHPLVTTPGHELALPVVFESGLLHFAGGPEEYRRLPETAKAFLRTVPVAWDETRFLDGFPGKLAILARRSGQTWYVAGIEGEGRARQIELKLGFLGPGEHRAVIIGDGAEPKALASRVEKVFSGDPIRLDLRPSGGFVGIIDQGGETGVSGPHR